MDDNRKRAILLAVAFALPLLFIMVIFITTFIPATRLSTDFNFVYATCSKNPNPGYYYCNNYLQNLYDVSSGRIMEREISSDLDSDNDGVLDINENYTTRLFLHDTTLNVSEEISLIEAQRLQLSDEIVSPDGVAVERDYSSGGSLFPFVRVSSRFGWYLSRGSARQKLEVIGDSERNYYRDDLMFLGWVLNDR